MIYHFKVHKDKNTFWAECIELPGCYTQGDTLQELKDKAQEALDLYLQEPNNSEELAPLPNESIRKSKNIIEVAVDALQKK